MNSSHWNAQRDDPVPEDVSRLLETARHRRDGCGTRRLNAEPSAQDRAEAPAMARSSGMRPSCQGSRIHATR